MTRAAAISTGQNAASRFGKAFVVYRFPAWKADVFGVIAVDRELPPQAETFERLEPIYEGPQQPAPAPPATPQGSLF